MRVYVELSGEAPALARAELWGAMEAIGATRCGATTMAENLVPIELLSKADAERLARRLALARRVLWRWDPPSLAWTEGSRSAGHSGAFRSFGRPTEPMTDSPILREWVRDFKAAGGRLDLDRPERRFWVLPAPGHDALLEEVALVDRAGIQRRRMPNLPFQRPVGLDPRLARAAVNLARIRPGEKVVDPFLGTGALLAEAGLVGARIFGIDRSDEMVRGALRNFAFLGVSAEGVAVGDGGDCPSGFPPGEWDVVVTDPPYGRSSSPGTEGSGGLRQRVLATWADRMRPGARAVVIAPSESPPLQSPWELVEAIPVRVHRSLTRVFSLYRRAG